MHAQKLSAHGVLGRLLDAVRAREPPLAAGGYSLDGNSKMLEGLQPADVIDKSDGVVRYTSYAELAPTIRRMVGNASSHLLAETYASLLHTSLDRTEQLGNSLANVSLTQAFGSTSMGLQLAQVARLIATRDFARMEREAFFVSLGRFDMHNEVNESLTARFTEIDGALRNFVREMQAMGVWDSVTMVSASDFGRTLTSNGLGTDHAWAGHNFILGGSVKGARVLGKYPRGLREEGPRSENILRRGRVLPSLSWEAVWSAVAPWFGAADEQLATILPNRGNFPAHELYTEADVFTTA